MREDLERLAHIPGAMLNFHPGSHVRQGVEIGVRYIADMLDAVMAEGTATPILLETMAGKGRRSDWRVSGYLPCVRRGL